MSYIVVRRCLHDDIEHRLVTYTRTHTRSYHIPRYSIASRCKNCICLSARISHKRHSQTSRNFLYTLPMAVARSSYNDNAIRYVDDCVPIMGLGMLSITTVVDNIPRTTSMYNGLRSQSQTVTTFLQTVVISGVPRISFLGTVEI